MNDFSGGIEFHEFGRFCAPVIRVVEHDGVESTQNIVENEGQVGKSLKPALEIAAERIFADDSSGRVSKQVDDYRRSESDALRVMRQDCFEIVGIPRTDPMFGKLASFLSRKHSFVSIREEEFCRIWKRCTQQRKERQAWNCRPNASS